MKKARALLFAVIFLGAAAFFLLSPKQEQPQQNFNFYNIPILAAVLIWVGWKFLELLKKHKRLNS